MIITRPKTREQMVISDNLKTWKLQWLTSWYPESLKRRMIFSNNIKFFKFIILNLIFHLMNIFMFIKFILIMYTYLPLKSGIGTILFDPFLIDNKDGLQNKSWGSCGEHTYMWIIYIYMYMWITYIYRYSDRPINNSWRYLIK